ncbi:hypothetical protein GOBAR_DD12977 [Gossypium barbadense]|nr:hypothetical protein GOBAR_DD12977 [Gossypium barbadense]
MGFGFQILHMIFIILILQSSYILIADALMEYTAEGFRVDGVQQLYFMEGSGGNENKIEKVSGQDDNEVKIASIVLKFRALLGLKSSTKTRTPLKGVNGCCYTPSPSPLPNIEAEVSVPIPAPAPAVPKVSHFHSPPPWSSSKPQPYKVHEQNGDKGRVKRFLVPVLVSVGAVSLACVLGVICFCGKIRKYKRKSMKTGRIRGKSKCLSSQNSSNKVSLDPSIDLFYLNSLGVSLEQQQACLKTSPNHSKECSTREITSVHEDVESGRYDSDDGKSSVSDKIIPMECHSSDDESFHSFVDSHSPNARLSNASAATTRATMRTSSSSSSTLLNETPSRNSDSSLGLNQNEANLVDTSYSPRIPSTVSPSPPSVVPPPPRPPPFLKSPPPPPPQLPQYSPIGKDGVPLPKLKPLHWDKVRAAPDRSMVWDKLRSSSFELDEEMMESLFGYNIQNPMKNDETKSKTPSPSKHVLEPKRLQNITILLKALNVTAEQACNALMKGNGLFLQQLEALVKMVPTKEEETKLYGYKGDVNELGSAEKFVKVLLSVPFAFLRAEAMLYRETFDDEVIHLKSSFSMLEEACKELRSSRLFLKLLEAVLKTGNRMNVGTIRGGARAFKLDALLKLADVKGTDGKTTLLHFVVQEIVHLVSGLSTELYHVKKTATLDLDVLASSVSNLSDGKAKLQHLVREELSTDEKSGNFVRSMNSFLDYAEKNLKELEEDEHKAFYMLEKLQNISMEM